MCKHFCVLNEISKYIIVFASLIVIGIYIRKNLKEQNINTNSVELHTQYKKYIVLNKYSKDSLYILELKNPITKDVSSVAISEWIYYNLYFVGDTIK